MRKGQAGPRRGETARSAQVLQGLEGEIVDLSRQGPVGAQTRLDERERAQKTMTGGVGRRSDGRGGG